MAWVVHYWDEINKRNISSTEISNREDAMQKACKLMQQGRGLWPAAAEIPRMNWMEAIFWIAWDPKWKVWMTGAQASFAMYGTTIYKALDY